MSTITVRSIATTIPVSVLRTDELGRRVILCPVHLDEAYIEADGRVVCPMQDMIAGALAGAFASWEASERGFLDTIGAPPTPPITFGRDAAGISRRVPE